MGRIGKTTLLTLVTGCLTGCPEIPIQVPLAGDLIGSNPLIQQEIDPQPVRQNFTKRFFAIDSGHYFSELGDENSPRLERGQTVNVSLMWQIGHNTLEYGVIKLPNLSELRGARINSAKLVLTLADTEQSSFDFESYLLPLISWDPPEPPIWGLSPPNNRFLHFENRPGQEITYDLTHFGYRGEPPLIQQWINDSSSAKGFVIYPVPTENRPNEEGYFENLRRFYRTGSHRPRIEINGSWSNSL
jgi:hypothetical protein